METRATWRVDDVDESGGTREWESTCVGSTDVTSVGVGGGGGAVGDSGAGGGGREGRGMCVGEGEEEGGEWHAL